jgi:hypothetical protein
MEGFKEHVSRSLENQQTFPSHNLVSTLLLCFFSNQKKRKHKRKQRFMKQMFFLWKNLFFFNLNIILSRLIGFHNCLWPKQHSSHVVQSYRFWFPEATAPEHGLIPNCLFLLYITCVLQSFCFKRLMSVVLFFCLFVLTCFFFFWQMQSDLRYPNGDSNVITIRKHYYETLEPKQFLNDTIFDFYLK